MRNQLRVVAVGMVLALATTASAQLHRLLPTNGKLGELLGQQHQFPLVQIDRKLMRLAPGGVIVDQNNRFILHGYLPQQAYVLYVVDNRGDVARIVLLTPEELARLQQSGTR